LSEDWPGPSGPGFFVEHLNEDRKLFTTKNHGFSTATSGSPSPPQTSFLRRKGIYIEVNAQEEHELSTAPLIDKNWIATNFDFLGSST